jgi:hypothetical protein
VEMRNTAFFVLLKRSTSGCLSFIGVCPSKTFTAIFRLLNFSSTRCNVGMEWKKMRTLSPWVMASVTILIATITLLECTVNPRCFLSCPSKISFAHCNSLTSGSRSISGVVSRLATSEDSPSVFGLDLGFRLEDFAFSFPFLSCSVMCL